MKSKNNIKLKSRLHLYFIIPAFLAGLLVGYLMKSNQTESLNDSSGRMEKHQGGYKFINPLLECDIAQGRIDKLIHSFKDGLSALIEEIKNSGMVTDVSVYFRDLNNGPWYGINEKEKFLPASLLKVPLMMAYYKAAESDPGILNKKVIFEDKFKFKEAKVYAFPPEKIIEPGKEYTIEELIEGAIIYSDNQTLPLLYHNIPDKTIGDLFKVLGIDPELYKKADATISVLSYASFFRVLYNASYLNKEYSEKALDLLSRVDYKTGLREGVPAEITVAQKFGEGGYLGMERQLHDCGIIYHPLKPYLLCVMTRGEKIADLENAIRDISKWIFERVNKDTLSERY